MESLIIKTNIYNYLKAIFTCYCDECNTNQGGNMLIGSFFHECAKYSVHFQKGQFVLSMNPSFEYFEKEYGELALLYVDEETLDDVNVIKNPFFVIQQSVQIISEYVWKNRLSYFHFSSSTERKDKIYPWIGKKIIHELAKYKKHYQFMWYQGRFDFWQEKPKRS